jgi:hypothetical protein
LRQLIGCCLILLLLCILSNCVATETIVYKDVPADSIVIKRDTLDKALEELISTKRELMECLEREK